LRRVRRAICTLGGARTALFNWLYARHTGGKFILRIEDTDSARNTQEAVDVILHGLRWLGLEWDEGPLTRDPAGASKGDYGPYFQSQRRQIYEARVAELRDKGFAYEQDGALRFRMERNPIIIPDLVVGNVTRELTDRERLDPDFVLIRSDGQPVFHLVNVIDDIEMKITHVIRGEDHLANSAKHLTLFKAFGVEPPKYAHIPLILNVDGTKMSKRDQGASLSMYMQEHFVPEAVVNYLYLLGWSPKGNREVMPIQEVIEVFDLPQILRHNARFDLDKLYWVNHEYIKMMDLERFSAFAEQALRDLGIEVTVYPKEYRLAAFSTVREKVKQFGPPNETYLRMLQEKGKQLHDVRTFTDFYFLEQVRVEDASRKDITDESKRVVGRLKSTLEAAADFKADTINGILKQTAADLGLKIGLLVHPTRLACTGKTVGPSLYHLMEVLGRERVLKRLQDFVDGKV
jgi:glutamyl-tRNA synthetase